MNKDGDYLRVPQIAAFAWTHIMMMAVGNSANRAIIHGTTINIYYSANIIHGTTNIKCNLYKLFRN